MSGATSGYMNSISVITQAYLNITQSTTQGFYNQQVVDVDCRKDSVECNRCIQLANEYGLVTNNNYSNACPVCFCTLENINLSSIIKLDLTSFQTTSASISFGQQVINSITQKAGEAGKQLFNFTDDAKKSLIENANSIYSIISKTSVQQSLEQLNEFQILALRGSNTQAINVNLNVATTFISKVFQSNLQNSSALSSMENTILQISTSTMESGFASIISIIVTLAVIFIIGLTGIFAFNIILQILELYAVS